MRTFLFSVFTCISSQAAFAQANPFMKDVNGRPLYLRISYVADGSPYLADAYRAADITTTGNKTYTGIMTKVNIMENLVQLLSPDGVEMVASLPIKKIRFHAAGDGASRNVILESSTAINEPGTKVGTGLWKNFIAKTPESRFQGRQKIQRSLNHTRVYSYPDILCFGQGKGNKA